MTQPISWHAQCLSDYCASLDRKVLALSTLQLEVSEMKKRAAHYKAQIVAAREWGMDEFDADRFLGGRTDLNYGHLR